MKDNYVRATVIRVGVFITAAASVLTIGQPALAAPAHCSKSGCRPASNLRWEAPRTVVNGGAFHVSSVSPCPEDRPDGSPIVGTRYAFVGLFFSGGGSVMGPIEIASDGSWSTEATFTVEGVSDQRATLSAWCADVAIGAETLGDYRSKSVDLVTDKPS